MITYFPLNYDTFALPEYYNAVVRNPIFRDVISANRNPLWRNVTGRRRVTSHAPTQTFVALRHQARYRLTLKSHLVFVGYFRNIPSTLVHMPRNFLRSCLGKYRHQISLTLQCKGLVLSYVENSKNHNRWYYFAAHCRNVTVLRCNTIFCDVCCFLRTIKTRPLHWSVKLMISFYH